MVCRKSQASPLTHPEAELKNLHGWVRRVAGCLQVSSVSDAEDAGGVMISCKLISQRRAIQHSATHYVQLSPWGQWPSAKNRQGRAAVVRSLEVLEHLLL